jgi:hypothetical protein
MAVWKDIYYIYNDATAPIRPGPPHYRGFTLTLRHTTLDRIPPDEWSDRRRDLHLTTHSIHKQQNIHACGGIRTRNPSKRAAADPRLRPPDHWDRLDGYEKTDILTHRGSSPRPSRPVRSVSLFRPLTIRNSANFSSVCVHEFRAFIRMQINYFPQQQRKSL